MSRFIKAVETLNSLAKEGEFEHWLTEFEDYHDLETEENTDDRPGTLLYEEF